MELTTRGVAHLHAVASRSQSRSRAAAIVAADLRLKAGEYRAQTARIREILDRVGLARDNLSPAADFRIPTSNLYILRKFYAKMQHSVSCAIHSHAVRVSSGEARGNRQPPERFRRKGQLWRGKGEPSIS